MSVYFHNKSAISIDHNSVQDIQAKHVKVGRHFMKEKLEGR